MKGCRSIRTLSEDRLKRVCFALGQEKCLAKFDILQRDRLRSEDFNGGGQGHLQIGRGGQHGDTLDAVVIEMRQGLPVQRGLPEVGSHGIWRGKMPAQKGMAPLRAPSDLLPL